MKEAIKNVQTAFEEQEADFKRRLEMKDAEILRLKTINEALSNIDSLQPFLKHASDIGMTFDEWLTNALEMIKGMEDKAILVDPEVKKSLERIALVRSQPLRIVTCSKKATAGFKRAIDNEWV